MKPRQSVIKLPSITEEESEPPPAKVPRTEPNRLSPTPSTSRSSPKHRPHSTLAKIRGITTEIRHLTNLSLSSSFDSSLKRPFNLTTDVIVPEKKQKLD